MARRSPNTALDAKEVASLSEGLVSCELENASLPRWSGKTGVVRGHRAVEAIKAQCKAEVGQHQLHCPK